MLIYVHIHVCTYMYISNMLEEGNRAEVRIRDDVINSVFSTGLIHALHTVGT